VSDQYKQLQRCYDLADKIRAHAARMGSSCELGWSLRALAADVEVTAYNDFNCQSTISMRVPLA
jgi:hypothetical protein